jgi:arsenical pump membrane protein
LFHLNALNSWGLPYFENRMVQLVLGLGIFLATLVSVLIRPPRLSEAQAALLGAAAMLLVGIVPPGEAITAILREWNVYLFFLGLMVTAALADGAGVFVFLADRAAEVAGGSMRRLYAAVFLVGAGVTAVLSNDATALLLTPIVVAMVQRLHLPALPFLFATTFIADTASFLLPVSNPINVLLLGTEIDLLTFFRFLMLPALASVVINYAVFAWWFADALRGCYRLTPLESRASFDRMATRRMLYGLGVLAVGYVAATWAHVPLGPVALAGALWLGIVATSVGTFDWATVRRGISWSLFGFLTGMVIIVHGLERLGLTSWFGTKLLALGGDSPFRMLLVTAFGTALGSNLINNVPMALVMRAALTKSAPAGVPLEALRYAALLGADLGPNLTIIGSLATILWVLLLRQYGITISVRQYLILGLLVVPAMLLIGVVAIWLQI